MNFIGFGAMDVTKPYEFIGFGALVGAAPTDSQGRARTTSAVRTTDRGLRDSTLPRAGGTFGWEPIWIVITAALPLVTLPSSSEGCDLTHAIFATAAFACLTFRFVFYFLFFIGNLVSGP